MAFQAPRCVASALRARGLLAATTAENLEAALLALRNRSDEDSRNPRDEGHAPACYVGFDPTASSLHVGNLVSLRVLQIMQCYGFRPIALVGGATGLIGDPSGRSTERNLQTVEEVTRNADAIEKCVRSLLRQTHADHHLHEPQIVNNVDWYLNQTPLDFVRDVGKHFRMGPMLARESVRSRLQDGGMSFTEFSYQLFQAYDFLHLYRHHDCVLQIGGSDQWGNILGGCELIRKVEGHSAEVHGITVPLLTSSNGEKLGKSAGNAVWVDPALVSAFDFYQYFLRIEDSDVEKCCAMLAIDPMASAEEITNTMENIMRAHYESPGDRTAQKFLAESMTRWVHGDEGLERAQQASKALFSTGNKSFEKLTASDLEAAFSEAPTKYMPKGDIIGKSLISLAMNVQACRSKGEGRRMVKSGGMYLNQLRVTSPDVVVSENDLVDGQLLLLRIGKKKYTLVKVTTE